MKLYHYRQLIYISLCPSLLPVKGGVRMLWAAIKCLTLYWKTHTNSTVGHSEILAIKFNVISTCIFFRPVNWVQMLPVFKNRALLQNEAMRKSSRPILLFFVLCWTYIFAGLASGLLPLLSGRGTGSAALTWYPACRIHLFAGAQHSSRRGHTRAQKHPY